MSSNPPKKQWFAMRDLSRRNANIMAHHTLSESGVKVFTPMKEMIMTIRGRKQIRNVPVIQDLLFVHEEKNILDSHVRKIPRLQYRYSKGKTVNEPLVIPDDCMQMFIFAVSNTENPKYFMPGDLTEAMLGKKVHIIGGALDGFEGYLLSVRGMRKRRLIVSIPNFVAAAVEVQPEFIKLE